MSTHNICFHEEIRKILCGYPLLSVAMVIWIKYLSIMQTPSFGKKTNYHSTCIVLEHQWLLVHGEKQTILYYN